MFKPRITVFTKLFWPEGGGAELATYLTVKNILSKHFDIVIMTGTKKPKVDVLRCCRYIYWPILKTKYKPVEWLKIFANTKTIRKLVEQSDIVYIPSHTLLPLAIIAKIIKPSVKVVIHLHNYQPLTYTSVVLTGKEPNLATDIFVERGEHDNLLRTIAAGVGHYLNFINEIALYYADKVLCVSRGQLEILARYILVLQSKAMVIYNPPPPVPSIEKKLCVEPTILYIGGGSFVKGFYVAIKALAKVLLKFNCRVCMTYGRNVSLKQKQLLKKLASKLGNKLILLGKLPYEELLKLHESTWGMLFPSIGEEPLPYAIVEAMALGTIPVASKVGGVLEIINGTPAEKFLFTAGDVDEFIDKIEQMLSLSKEEVLNIGAKLRDEVKKKLSMKLIEENLLKVFTKAL